MYDNMIVTVDVSGEQLPDIRVQPPGPNSQALAKELIKYESKGVSSIAIGKIPIVWERAKGSNIVDADGNIYIEMTAGFTVAITGHTNPRIVEAIQKQAEKMIHAQGAINPNVPRIELAKKLNQITPGDIQKCIFLSTGAEAIELALKTARLYTGKRTVIAFHGGFHGKTYGALSVTSRNFYREQADSYMSGTVHVPYPYCYRCPFCDNPSNCSMRCVSYLENLLDDPSSGMGSVAAILLEPIQGHEGVIVPPAGFLKEIRRICDERDILMITDEIITGFGRTGKLFAVNHEEVTPDLMTVAKGIASGFPISALVGKEAVMDSWATISGESTHSSTFLANPLGCAASLASIAEIEEKQLVQRSATIGAKMLEGFKAMERKYSIIGDVRGKGMYVGVEIVQDRESKKPAPELAGKIAGFGMNKGVLVNPGGRFSHVLKFSPPLVITEEQLSFALDVYDEAFKTVQP